jgi:L-ascorbate metabolism protein UlaG (beta-lactamase superfamily)
VRARITSISSVLIAAGVAFHCSAFRATLPADYHAAADQSPDERVELYWVGHATALIRIYDRWILTDPVWSTYLGPVKRYVAPSMAIETLPFVDFTLISHTHLDHLDRPTLQRIPGSRHILAPRGGVGYIPPERFAFVHGVSPGDVVADEDLRVIVVPAQHFGGRYVIDNLWDGEPYQG